MAKYMRLTYAKIYSIFGIKCKKWRRLRWLRPRPRWRSLRRSPRPPSREGLLAFGNRSFAPSALALSQHFSRSVLPQSYIQIFASGRLWLQTVANFSTPDLSLRFQVGEF